MKKIILLLALLTLIFVSGCNVPDKKITKINTLGECELIKAQHESDKSFVKDEFPNAQQYDCSQCIRTTNLDYTLNCDIV